MGRGLVNFDADEVPAFSGRTTGELKASLGAAYEREVAHRDDLVPSQSDPKTASAGTYATTDGQPAALPVRDARRVGVPAVALDGNRRPSESDDGIEPTSPPRGRVLDWPPAGCACHALSAP